MDNALRGFKLPQIRTKRCLITLLQHYDYQRLQDYCLSNCEYLSPWEPLRDSEYFTESSMRKRLQASNEQFAQGDAVHFVALPINDDPSFAEIIGVCNFTNIVRGSFQACNLGYSVAEKHQGKGLMREILKAGIGYMFDDMQLHRIMANYMPENTRSGRLLSSLGFEKEGVAKAYLNIAGQWQDHILTSKINSR